MIQILSCKDYAVHATVKTPKEATAILKGKPFHTGFSMFAQENGRIVGDDVDGYTGSTSEMLPYHERSGSVLTGREQE